MPVPVIQQMRVGAYVLRQKLLGNERYPLVLMLEPLFRCNLACAGCGKIDYPTDILNKRLSVQECLEAADECGAPIVSIPGGEPLLHREIVGIVEGLVARKKFVYLCTNALLLEKRLDLFTPSPYLTFPFISTATRIIMIGPSVRTACLIAPSSRSVPRANVGSGSTSTVLFSTMRSRKTSPISCRSFVKTWMWKG